MEVTDDKLIKLCEDVATIAANISALTSKLDDHTRADNDNFQEMKEMVTKTDQKIDSLLREKLEGVILQLAEQRGAAKNRAIIWSLISSGGLLTAFEFLKSVWFK